MGFRLYLCLALASLANSALASVLAIDYGSDSIKVSLMKPGVPFDVVLNRDSKRKILSAVGWKGDDRLFGADGFNVAARYPSDSFPALKTLQGGNLNDQAASFHASLFPYLKVIETPRQTYAFIRPSGIEYTTEELIGMQFSYVKELAEGLASGEKITDAVVTVPAYYSQFERQAVLDSVSLAGMRTLALINDGAAVAVNYAMTRSFANPETHIIYDAGASGIRATVVTFSTITPGAPSSSSSSSSSTDSASSAKTTKAAKAKKAAVKPDVTHIDIKGFGYDRVASGLTIDRRLRDIIVNDFESSKNGRSLKTESRALAKLWKDLAKVKAILSTNTETRVTIESFLGDTDLRSKVTRASFEKACEDLKPRFTQPIRDALASAGLTMNDISSVIIVGGSSRVPMVQAALKQAVGEDKIAHNVNADEAAVLGAAFYGASLSRNFKTKEIKVQDLLSNYDVQVSYGAESKPGRIINTLIFPAQSKVGAKKTLTLKRKDDFALTVSYKAPVAGDIPTNIFEATIVGIADAVANLTSRGAIEPVVKLTVTLSESGITSIQEALVYGEVKDDSIAGSSSATASSTGSTDDLSSPTQTATDPDATPVEAKPVPNTIPLKIQFRSLTVPPLTSEEKSKSRAKLVALDKAENARARKEEARNHLEGYLYRLRDLLDGEETSPFIEFSKEEERKVLSENLETASAWMSEHSETAETIEFWDKRSALETLEKPIQHRYQEAETGPKAFADLQQALAAGRVFLHSARENATTEATEGLPSKYTPEELSAIEARLKEDEGWLAKNVEIQKQHKKYDDPVLLTAEMKARGVTLQNQVMKLLKRKAPKPPKPSSTSASAATATATSSPEEATEVPVETEPKVRDEL